MKSDKSQVISRELPHNIQAEQAVIGSFIIDNSLAADVLPSLLIEDFYSPSHRTIIETLIEMVRTNVTIELITLVDKLERENMLNGVGGLSYINSMVMSIPSVANFKVSYEIVKRDSVLRRLIKSCSEIIDDCYISQDSNLTVVEAEKKIYDISRQYSTNEIVNVKDVTAKVYQRIADLSSNPDMFKGIRTGLSKFDAITNGLRAGELIVLAARPGVGKSSMAMNIAEQASYQNKISLVFSLEMPADQIVQRLMCSVGSFSMTKASSGKNIKDFEYVSLWQAKLSLDAQASILIDDSSVVTPAEILAKCRRVKAKYGLDLVIVDYIQLMNSGNRRNENRQQEISEITRFLKIIAKELKVPIIALSQMSRSIEMQGTRKPVLSDLRESGAIEQDADVVAFIHKPKDEKEGQVTSQVYGADELTLIIAKNRNGRTDEIELLWIGDIVKFIDRDYNHIEIKKLRERNINDGTIASVNEAQDYLADMTDQATANGDNIINNDNGDDND